MLSPTFSVTLVLSRVIPLTGAAVTVSFFVWVWGVPSWNLTVTVILVSPARIALILPFPSTVAYFVFSMLKERLELPWMVQ